MNEIYLKLMVGNVRYSVLPWKGFLRGNKQKNALHNKLAILKGIRDSSNFSRSSSSSIRNTCF
jgi:hypothetical protein